METVNKRHKQLAKTAVEETSRLSSDGDTLGDGMTLKVFMIRSGYSSRILLISRVPIPEPVPPPRE